MILERLKQGSGDVQVGIHFLQWLGRGRARRGCRSKMHDGMATREQRGESFRFPKFADYRFNQGMLESRRAAVDGDDRRALQGQGSRQVAPDKTASAEDEYCLSHLSFPQAAACRCADNDLRSRPTYRDPRSHDGAQLPRNDDWWPH